MRSRARSGSVSVVMQRSSTAGCSCLKRAMRGSSHQVAVAVDTASVTCGPAVIARTSRSAWSISVRPRPTCSSRCRPASVADALVAPLEQRHTQFLLQRSRIAWLTAGWLI
jgi:hypothetical protein